MGGDSQTLDVLFNDWVGDNFCVNTNGDEALTIACPFLFKRGVEICSLTGFKVVVGMALLIKSKQFNNIFLKFVIVSFFFSKEFIETGDTEDLGLEGMFFVSWLSIIINIQLLYTLRLKLF